MNTTHFIHFIDGHLGGFHFGVIKNSATMDNIPILTRSKKVSKLQHIDITCCKRLRLKNKFKLLKYQNDLLGGWW